MFQSPQGLGKQIKYVCVCASVQTDLSNRNVSSFEMHGFSTPATGHVSFPDESEETPTPLFASFPLKAGRRGFPSERGGPAPLHLRVREGGLSYVSPHQAAPSRAFVPFQHLFSSAVASNVSHDALEDSELFQQGKAQSAGMNMCKPMCISSDFYFNPK